MSQVVLANGIVYLEGQVARRAVGIDHTTAAETLVRIYTLLASVATDKIRLWTASIWLSDIHHREKFNRVR